MSDKNLHSMDLGDKIKLDIWDVWRVPGGWIFGMDMEAAGGMSVFVPYDNEFRIPPPPF